MTEPTPEPSATSAKLMNPIVFVCKDSVADYRCDLDGQECLVFPFHPANNSTTTNLALEYKSCNIAKHVLTCETPSQVQIIIKADEVAVASQRALIMLKIRIRQQDRALIPLIESITGFEDLAKLVGARNIDPQYYDDLKQQIFARCELGAPSVNAVGFDEGWKQSKTPPNPVAIPLTLMPSYKYPTKYFKYVNFIQSLREAYEVSTVTRLTLYMMSISITHTNFHLPRRMNLRTSAADSAIRKSSHMAQALSLEVYSCSILDYLSVSAVLR